MESKGLPMNSQVPQNKKNHPLPPSPLFFTFFLNTFQGPLNLMGPPQLQPSWSPSPYIHSSMEALLPHQLSMHPLLLFPLFQFPSLHLHPNLSANGFHPHPDLSISHIPFLGTPLLDLLTTVTQLGLFKTSSLYASITISSAQMNPLTLIQLIQYSRSILMCNQWISGFM